MRWTKAAASKDVVKVFSSAYIREGRRDVREKSKEVEEGLEARLHKYGRGEKFDALLLGANGGRYIYSVQLVDP